MERVRERVRSALNGTRSGAGVGCSSAELRAHIEAQFLPGMGWHNRHLWHVDHIRPLASFDLTDAEQRRAANHYTNLRPLWAEDNLAKGAKVH